MSIYLELSKIYPEGTQVITTEEYCQKFNTRPIIGKVVEIDLGGCIAILDGNNRIHWLHCNWITIQE